MSGEQLPIPGIGDMVLGTPHQKPNPTNNSSMPSPRLGDLVLGFQPSTYQKQIFDWLTDGEGSCVVCAVPGSGKTTTLIKGSHYIPKSRKSRFLAFNKHIATELEAKLPKHIKASTIHSLGLSSIARRFRGVPEVNPRKYANIVSGYLADRKVHNRFERNRLIELVKFTQLTLTNPDDDKALKQLCYHYGIPTIGDWQFLQQAVRHILEHGIKLAGESISYEDMVWLPYELSLPVYTYDFLCVDEAQDLNKAQLELVMKAHSAGARGIFVGDPHQAIMGFCAADTRSISNIIERTNATKLPLSICYRCPTSHIELANQIYPVIQASPGAASGKISYVSISEIPQLARVGDLMICRCFYPLVPVYFDLLAAGIPVKIRNKDLSNRLINLIEQIVGEKSKSYTASEFTNVLTQWYEETKAEMRKTDVEIMVIVALHDRIRTLDAIYKGSKCNNTEELKQIILSMCKEEKNVVKLTTIHGAKGLEAERVFHLRPDLIPHSRAEKDWEREQEKNLEFVALTRAKKELFFVK